MLRLLSPRIVASAFLLFSLSFTAFAARASFAAPAKAENLIWEIRTATPFINLDMKNHNANGVTLFPLRRDYVETSSSLSASR